MRNFISLLTLLIIYSLASFAQNNKEIALTIGSKPIYKEALQKAYDKDKSIQIEGDKRTFNDFLESYILNRQTIEEAKNRRIDTTATYLRELSSYRLQLADAYLRDTITKKKIREEVRGRFENELEINHIYIPFHAELKFATDTVEYFGKVMNARKLAAANGFGNIEGNTTLQSYGIVVKVEEQSGYLGWIKPFMFSFELEEFIYALKLNEISMPVRTRNGYHIFQVIGKRPIQGTPIVEQVMFNFPQIPASEAIRDSVYKVAKRTYDEIAAKGNFQEVCDEFATIFNLGKRGCLLGEVSVGAAMPLVLIKETFELTEPNQISNLVLSEYGYHILRLKEIKPAPSREVVAATIAEALESDKLFPELHNRMRLKLMDDNKASIVNTAYDKLAKLTAKYNPVDSQFEDHVTNKTDIILQVEGDEGYTVQDFLDYIVKYSWLAYGTTKKDPMEGGLQAMVTPTLYPEILKEEFNSFIYLVLSNYQKRTLENENPQFKATVEKLSEEFLYTTIMDEEIWTKSKIDFVGLQTTFEKNRSKYTLSGKPFKGHLIHSKDAGYLEEIEALYKKEKSINQTNLRKKYNAQAINIQVETGLWRKGDNPFVDTKIFESGAKRALPFFPHYTVIGEFITSPQEYRDVPGQVEKDYEEELNSKWKRMLGDKYKVELNETVIKKIR